MKSVPDSWIIHVIDAIFPNLKISNSRDSVRQVRRLGVVLLGVYHVSVNMFPTYTIYIPKPSAQNWDWH